MTSDSADVPPPPPTFDALALSTETRRAVDDMGFVTPTPVQIATFEPTVEGKDLVVQARTGTGKTAAFGLPIIDRIVTSAGGVQALVLAPTRELALQSAREMERIGTHKGIRTSAVYGGAPMDRQVRELEQGAQIVSGTPGRVLDHLKRGTLDPSGLRVLVLDEADEMLSMGFAKELNAILERLPKQRQTLFFSATIDDGVKRLAERHMKEPVYIALSGDAVGAQSIAHFTYHLSGLDRPGDLVRILEVENPESAVIFCNMKVTTERVAQALQAAGFDADWLNGDLSQSDREKVMQATREKRLRFMVSTDVAARGIDISHLTHVINYELPETAEQYVHRTGRTGRAGRTGTAISLVSPREIGALYYLRLQYRIFPIDRSLPSSAEERTRREADRLTMLAEAFGGEPRDVDRAVARRLLSHVAAEKIVAGMIGAFFGAKGGDVDEQAAAERRAKPPAAVPETMRDRVPRSMRDDRGPRGDRGAREGRGGRGERDRDRGPREERAARPPREVRAEAPYEGSEDTPTIPPAPPTEPPSAAPTEPGLDLAPPPVPRDRPRERDRDRPRERDRDRGPEEGQAMLFLGVGRREGVRPGEIVKLLTGFGLAREAVGRIRIRDKHTFVAVPQDHADRLIAELTGQPFYDRPLVVERAKAGDE